MRPPRNSRMAGHPFNRSFALPSVNQRGLYRGVPRPVRQPHSFLFRSDHEFRHHPGNFLTRLFSGRKSSAPQAGPFRFGTNLPVQEQTGIGSILNPESISRFLGQTQQVIRAGQQISTMVQQYGPLIRNLPALWKIYRGLKMDDSEEETEEQETTDSELIPDEEIKNINEKIAVPEDGDMDDFTERKPSKKHELKKEEHAAKTKEKRKREQKYIIKKSVPKLYI